MSRSQWVQCSCALDPIISQFGSSLGPVHRSTGSVKIITRVQKLDTCQDLNGSNAPVHWTQSFPSSGAAWVQCIGPLDPLRSCFCTHVIISTGPVHCALDPILSQFLIRWPAWCLQKKEKSDAESECTQQYCQNDRCYTSNAESVLTKVQLLQLSH